jgi:hypothetical protein
MRSMAAMKGSSFELSPGMEFGRQRRSKQGTIVEDSPAMTGSMK